jgi:tRNA A37 methylthiotransferase MiaB
LRQRNATFGRFVGRQVEAVVEEPGFARTAHYLPLTVAGDTAAGTWIQVSITGHTDDSLVGTING